MSFNGWNNRETWVVNQFLEDELRNKIDEIVEEYCSESGDPEDAWQGFDDFQESMQETMYERMNYENLPTIVKEFMDEGVVDWAELFREYLDEAEMPEVEEDDDENETDNNSMTL